MQPLHETVSTGNQLYQKKIAIMDLEKMLVYAKSFVKGPTKLVAGPFNFYLLSKKPMVLISFTMGSLEHVHYMSQSLNGLRSYLLIGLWWDVSRLDRAYAFVKQFNSIRKRFPEKEYIVMCNTQEEIDSIKMFCPDAKCVLLSANCFVDESEYSILGVEKVYDAVYNARLGPYKRWELASSVDNLLAITAPYGKNGFDSNYARKIMGDIVSHARWINFDKGEYRRLGSDEINWRINQSRVGLILSKVEGACYAVVEYLLCGLPVVSTFSRGGRSEFLTPNNSVIVKDTPLSVLLGVKMALSNSFSSEKIRNEVLGVMWSHRERFFDLVNEIWRDEGVVSDMREKWDNFFVGKMNVKVSQDQFVYLLKNNNFDLYIKNTKLERRKES